MHKFKTASYFELLVSSIQMEFGQYLKAFVISSIRKVNSYLFPTLYSVSLIGSKKGFGWGLFCHLLIPLEGLLIKSVDEFSLVDLSENSELLGFIII